ncbi:MAG: hypothetical protein LUQ25_09665 [Methanoregulaceae archaeon]|nr:hypothetical protein [Methanoregulaceae archaeon]
MVSKTGPDEEPAVPGWAFVLGLVLGALVNLFIFWYLIIFWPGECSKLAALTGGKQTCGLQPGAYVVGAINVLLILVCLGFIGRWYRRRER